MKKIILFIIINKIVISVKQNNKVNNLYEITGYDMPAEFSSILRKKSVEIDLNSFHLLEEYKPKKYH